MADAAPNLRDPATEADLSGRLLGDFQLLRRFGRGAMAEVYLAEQLSLKRQVAVKILKSDLARDDSYVKRFHNEAHAAASLVHANIVQIYSVGCVDGIHYIAQEYVQGQNLGEWMSRHGPPDLKLAVVILRQVSAALHKASQAHIVHRDIKPENIMLARTGEVKVADFGLARQSRDTAANLTQVGITMGTPLYMSPEQVEGRALDSRSDLYSLGVTCYHMLAGIPPFRGETALAIAVQHLKTPPERLENLRPDLPPALCRIVHKLLAKEPKDRYDDARELLRDLRAIELPDDADSWPEDVPELDREEVIALDAIGQATQRLRTVMRATRAQRAVRATRYVYLAAGMALAALAGALLGWITREPYLLTDAEPPTVIQQNSAQEQFMVARMQSSNREEWLKSVKKFFPNDPYYVGLSLQDLARYYLQQPDRQDEALAVFRELAEQHEDEFEAFGLAGMSFVLTLQGNSDEAVQAIARLGPLRQSLKDRRMQQLVELTLRKNSQTIDAQATADWQDWLKSLPSEDTDSDTSGM